MKFATPGQELIYLMTNSGPRPQQLFKVFYDTVREDAPAEAIEERVAAKLVDLLTVYLEQLQTIQKAYDSDTAPESIRETMKKLFDKLYQMSRTQMDIGVSIGYCIGKYGDRNKKLGEWFNFDDSRKQELMKACPPDQRKFLEEYLRGKGN